MNGGLDPLIDIRAALAPHGIFLRGQVDFGETGDGPLLADGERAKTVVLLGNIGGSLWPAFARWHEDHPVADPLDTWSKSVIRPVAETFGAAAFFPSDPPWQPFQQWAKRAEGLKPSPLGILIHPRYGLWHGYRGALAFRQAFSPAPAFSPEQHPCDVCKTKPCLHGCPVDAVTADGFDVSGCRTHLATAAGQAGCMQAGCLAREACPVGLDYRYPAAQLRFHMAALSL
ncbi:ferredoxin [Rhizobium sp. LjRoot30]|uniref:ferredoxin n=1 Tax=Rhizobium sp. LjRoot30 TaxID=3342320 RepID=UPI003ED0B512